MSLKLSKLLEVCVQCGSCLTACPVYYVDRDEAVSPRGKLTIIKNALEGSVPQKEVEKIISYCSLCGGCEDACPNGIKTIDIMIEARKRWGGSKLKELVIDSISKETFPAHLITSLLALFFPEKLPFSPALRPYLSRTQEFRKGKGKGKVMLFLGCLVNQFFPAIAASMAEVILEAGFDLSVPKGQICCGFPYLSLGDREKFSKIREHNLKVIDEASPDIILSPCPTGINTLKRFYGLSNVYTISKFVLENISSLDLRKLNLKTTWHDPCHLRKELKIWKEPRELLSKISNFHEMERPDLCCGFGGSFSLSHPLISLNLRGEKRKYIRKSGADILVTECPGCVMFLGSFSPIRTYHMAEIVSKAAE